MKQFFVFTCISVVTLATFTSCFCPIIEFANRDCIEITKQPYYIQDIDAELCYYGTFKKECFFYQYIVPDSVLSLTSKQIKVNYRGKSLRFKLHYACNEGWKETDTITTVNPFVLKVSFNKASFKEGESLQIIESVPVYNDSVVTSIQMPIIYHQTQRGMSDDSKLFRFLKNEYNLYR